MLILEFVSDYLAHFLFSYTEFLYFNEILASRNYRYSEFYVPNTSYI